MMIGRLGTDKNGSVVPSKIRYRKLTPKMEIILIAPYTWHNHSKGGVILKVELSRDELQQ